MKLDGFKNALISKITSSDRARSSALVVWAVGMVQPVHRALVRRQGEGDCVRDSPLESSGAWLHRRPNGYNIASG